MSEDNVPTYNKEQLCAFARMLDVSSKPFPELVPTLPKFLIHVPDLQDGGAPIIFANIKEANFLYRQSGNILKPVRTEGMPQHVATDGSGWIVVNASDKGDAVKWKYHLTAAMKKSGKVDRALIENLLHYIQGFNIVLKTPNDQPSADPSHIHANTNPVINLAFDVYSMPQRDKDLKYESTPHKGYAGGAKKLAGLFYKKPEPYKTFFITGSFKVEYVRSDSWRQVQEYREGAYITIDPRGEISSIDPANIGACYGFLKEGVDFGDIKPGEDRSHYVIPVSKDNMERIPKFTRREVNLVLQRLNLMERGYPTVGNGGTEVPGV